MPPPSLMHRSFPPQTRVFHPRNHLPEPGSHRVSRSLPASHRQSPDNTSYHPDPKTTVPPASVRPRSGNTIHSYNPETIVPPASARLPADNTSRRLHPETSRYPCFHLSPHAANFPHHHAPSRHIQSKMKPLHTRLPAVPLLPLFFCASFLVSHTYIHLLNCIVMFPDLPIDQSREYPDKKENFEKKNCEFILSHCSPECNIKNYKM